MNPLPFRVMAAPLGGHGKRLEQRAIRSPVTHMSRAGSPGAFVAELCCTLEECCHQRPSMG